MQVTWFGLPDKRSKALTIGAKYYFTGKPCKYGHLSRRHADDRKCLECDRLYALKRQARAPERERAIFAEWREKNRPRVRENHKRSRTKNAEKVAARLRQWWIANGETQAAKRKTWAAENRHVIYALNAKRRAAEIQATPPWADRYAEEFKAIYAESIRLSKETGIKHHVDHYYPLRGKNSCGLHVPWNLQVIPAKENLSKRNRDPEATIIGSKTVSGSKSRSGVEKISVADVG